ncbi:aldehyde ferredoxin oxidoreductase family protein [Chloroflexota bacterium]
MAGGYMGKLLFVNLSTGELRTETPDETLYRDFIGGYGLGARILYNNQKGGVDPLGPENTLGIVTGPLTGTPATFGSRFVAVSKSPLTGSWGDANAGGQFGPYLKFSGFDGVFVNGIAEKPVYLVLDNGKAELKDANHLWGKGTYEVEDALEKEYGPEAKVISIGLSGEKLSLISCLITGKGDAAGRSGLGAVMGSKKLKAVVVRGDMKVPVIDDEAAKKLRQEQITASKAFFERFGFYGTSSHADSSALDGDTPVKNWGGVGIKEMPDVSGLDKDVIGADVDRRKGCWHCPAACKAVLKAGTGEYQYPAGIHRPEYETLGALGALCCNTNSDAIKMMGHLCNLYGMDTISAGATIAFAMECYENGIITKADTDGIELTWGNHRVMVDILEKMIKREGFGEILADGVKMAAEKIGKGSEEYAVHIGGQDLGMHDPKGSFFAYAGKPKMAMYMMDATPGRHTTNFGPQLLMHSVMNAAGSCMHGDISSDPRHYITGFLKAVTGWDRSVEELEKCGERIVAMRHVFSLREGDNPLKRFVHPRIPGIPPQEEGPVAGVTKNVAAEAYWNLGALDWDMETTKPSRKKLIELGLDDVAEELWLLE